MEVVSSSQVQEDQNESQGDNEPSLPEAVPEVESQVSIVEVADFSDAVPLP